MLHRANLHTFAVLRSSVGKLRTNWSGRYEQHMCQNVEDERRNNQFKRGFFKAESRKIKFAFSIHAKLYEFNVNTV